MIKYDVELLKSILYLDEELYNKYGTYNNRGIWEFVDENAMNKIEKTLCDRVASIDDPNTLYILANNYNYEDGYNIPTAIIKNKNCCLSTALNMFYLAGGDILLHNRNKFLSYDRNYFGEQIDFLLLLEEMILESKFKEGKIGFSSYINPKYLKNVDPIIQRFFYIRIDGEELDRIRI